MPAKQNGVFWPGNLSDWGQVAQALAAVGAVITAGWWFLEQRQTYPRADLSQSLEVVRLDRGTVAIEVSAKLTNEGKKLIRLTQARVKLQSVTDRPFSYAELANLSGSAYWNSFRPISTPNPNQFNGGELRWPVVKEFDGSIDNHVEPGESDVLVFTFLVPCGVLREIGGGQVPLLRVATDIVKPYKEHEVQFAWKARSFVSASKQCGR